MAQSIDEHGIFKTFTICPNDPKTLLLDVRPHKEFKKKHINQAYCVRLANNSNFLADYSQSSYSLPWSQHCWWGKPVIVYGVAGLGKDHPVVKFLADEGRCSSVHYYKPGFEAFESIFPFLCTQSVKANSFKKYPSLILPGFLYLGDWADAQEQERLKEINIKRMVTVHNHPERLAVAPGVQHLKIELPDVEGADISAHFNSAYEYIADAERLKQPVLVHCGAGVSRSACLVMMYLMRSRLWSAQQCRDHCIAARSLVCPNDGFWRVLCALEGSLGILNRSDPNATMGFAGADAPDVKLNTQAAGQPVNVRMVTAKELKQQQEAAAAAKAAAEAAAAAAAEQKQGLRRGRARSSSSESRDRRHRSRSRSRNRDRARQRRSGRSSSRSLSSSRSRSRSRGRDRGRNTDRDSRRRRSRSSSREHKRSREAAAAAPSAPVAAEPAAAAGAASGQAGWLVTLEVFKPEGLVGQLVLGPMNLHQRVVFGRAPSCNVVLEHLSISRQHAQLSVDLAGSVMIMDMGSGHGTKLGDAWIKAQQQRTMPVGTQLKFGASTRVYKLLSVEKV